MKMLVAGSCLTLCDPTDCSPSGSSVHVILQARYCSGLPFPSPGDLPGSPALQAEPLPSKASGKSYIRQQFLGGDQPDEARTFQDFLWDWGSIVTTVYVKGGPVWAEIPLSQAIAMGL